MLTFRLFKLLMQKLKRTQQIKHWINNWSDRWVHWYAVIIPLSFIFHCRYQAIIIIYYHLIIEYLLNISYWSNFFFFFLTFLQKNFSYLDMIWTIKIWLKIKFVSNQTFCSKHTILIPYCWMFSFVLLFNFL